MEFGAPPDIGLPCVHCGLCLDTCPTYKVLGTEADSPRGRIYIMESVKAGRLRLDREAAGHLDGCLGCLACETACPSGVSYAVRFEEFRPKLGPTGAPARLWQRFSRRFYRSDKLLDAGLRAAALIDALGGSRLRRYIPGFGLLPGRSAATANPEQTPLERSRVHQPVYPRARVALLIGCVGDRSLPAVNRDAVEVLQRNDIEVVEVPEQACCGALALHEGERTEALALARRNVAAFAHAINSAGIDYIVSTAAGCGAMLRDYGELLAGDPDYGEAAAAVSRRCRDICELLVELGFEAPELPAEGRKRVAYHDACHLLHLCKVEAAPRKICEAATGVPPVDLGENSICCGSAGSYNLEHPAMAAELGARKAGFAAALGVNTVAVGNAGCLMQINRALALAKVPARAKHPVELLAQAYRDERAT